jgi:hypothetical protein
MQSIVFALGALCCGRVLPRFHRINNSFVHWDAVRRRLRGTASTNDELGLLKNTYTLVVYMIFGLIPIALFTAIFSPDAFGWTFSLETDVRQFYVIRHNGLQGWRSQSLIASLRDFRPPSQNTSSRRRARTRPSLTPLSRAAGAPGPGASPARARGANARAARAAAGTLPRGRAFARAPWVA